MISKHSLCPITLRQSCTQQPYLLGCLYSLYYLEMHCSDLLASLPLNYIGLQPLIVDFARWLWSDCILHNKLLKTWLFIRNLWSVKCMKLAWYVYPDYPGRRRFSSQWESDEDTMIAYYDVHSWLSRHPDDLESKDRKTVVWTSTLDAMVSSIFKAYLGTSKLDKSKRYGRIPLLIPLEFTCFSLIQFDHFRFFGSNQLRPLI